MLSAAATNTIANAIPLSATSLVRSHVQVATNESLLIRWLAAKLLDVATLKQPHLPRQALSHTLLSHIPLQSLTSPPQPRLRSVWTRMVKNENLEKLGTTLIPHVWSTFATVLTMSEPPRESAVTFHQYALESKLLRNTSLMSVAHHTLAKIQLVPRLSVQMRSHHAITVKNWLPYHTTNAAALTSASASETSVLKLALAHVQKAMSELSPTPMHAVQSLDVSQLILPPQRQLDIPLQLHTSIQQHLQLSILQLQQLPLLSHFHNIVATQSASTTRVKKFTTALAGHQKNAHTVNATLTVMSNARRLNALQ